MLRRLFSFALPAFVTGLLGLWLALPRTAEAAPRAAAQEWSAAGTLLEACTCAVPCTCNFGEAPSPHSYCHAVFLYRVDKGAWGGVDVSGLLFGGADGPKANLGFVDERATPAQRAALERLARAVFARGGPAPGLRPFLPARLVHEVKGNQLRLDIAGRGGFTGRVLIGGDGKTPIVVENNSVWPIRRAIKGKATPLHYKDERVGVIHGDGTNANYGAFSFTGTVDSGPVSTTAPKIASARSCCDTR